ncbi:MULTISPECIES: isochorismatase family cysteine hydrolase [unclassified Spirosoma]|uniref:isochorismatase family cysteine hydrolase n=1 Tax=unclassified Spirosoma TaxID=2621999 RepID=UPI000959CF15|nr:MULTISPECIES: isochorismatase family cysteine hydrolase [unclassified Spirosoma]MBN8820692.1 cysteine hydrolase [Spirosoma sp.]OJW76457.1 MAG: isochorismatase [Spirosoma sp. 48-14]
METKENDLHGNAPDSSPVVLLIIDMINDLEFPGGDELESPARRAADAILTLKQRARAINIPIVYVNDNFGKWRSDFTEVTDHVLHDGVRGRYLAEVLKPESDDYFVLKPKHSGFYATTLDTLLTYLKAKHIVLTGISTDSCILFTANDAYMRDLKLSIPADCVAAIKPTYTSEALAYMKRMLNADTTPSTELNLAELVQAQTQKPLEAV